MKQLLFAVGLAGALWTGVGARPGGPVTPTRPAPKFVNIPDANFKQALIGFGVDTDQDGEISPVEAQAVENLQLPRMDIQSLAGIA